MASTKLIGLITIAFCLNLSLGIHKIELTKWKLQSSNTTTGYTGKDISDISYNTTNWYPIRVPATVMHGLVQNEIYSSEKIYHGTYLDAIDLKQFDIPWWYRTQFTLGDATSQDQRVILTFKGLNYRANIWLNGVLIANSTTVVGAFRYFEFDITSFVTSFTKNVLAVQVYRAVNDVFPYGNNSTDLGISFIDWAPYSPDNSMGLWKGVELAIIDGPVAVRYPAVDAKVEWKNQVSSQPPSDAEAIARLSVTVELTNYKNSKVLGVLKGTVSGIAEFSELVSLNALETRQVTFSDQNITALNVENPKLWWPKQMGEQNFYGIEMEFMTTRVSDRLFSQFGIREISSKLNERGDRVYYVNHYPILIRGGGWAPDLLLRKNKTRLETEMKYVLDMGLNTIRLEGKMEDDDFFNLADKMGILIMPGWACCDAWQHWDYWGPEQYHVAQESLRSEVRRLRIHPSNVVFLYSSDLLPPEDLENQFLKILEQEKWPNPVLASASNFTSKISGPTGVKMSGPYSWEPPVYWLNDTVHGGAFSFLTEGGPGENPMTFESLVKTLDQEKLWPMNSDWDYHCGRKEGTFNSLSFFNPPLNARYGESASVKEYLYKASAATYEAHRAMFEGYSRNKYVSTGVIQWMLNNAMPQMLWHLYDYYHNPTGAYYGSKKAMEMIHPIYSYNDGSIWLINSAYKAHSALSVSADVYDFNANKVYQETQAINILNSDATLQLFSLPETFANLTTTYFLRLTVRNSSTNEEITRNTYWLSTVPDVLNWTASTGYNTPCSSYADFTQLQSLLPVELEVKSFTEKGEFNIDTGRRDEFKTQVVVTNPSKTIAFLVYVKLVRSTDREMVLPIIWNENYFTLLPGESQNLTASYDGIGLGESEAELEVQVWNNIVPHSKSCIQI